MCNFEKITNCPTHGAMIAITTSIGVVAFSGVALAIIGLTASPNGLFRPIVQLGARVHTVGLTTAGSVLLFDLFVLAVLCKTISMSAERVSPAERVSEADPWSRRSEEEASEGSLVILEEEQWELGDAAALSNSEEKVHERDVAIYSLDLDDEIPKIKLSSTRASIPPFQAPYENPKDATFALASRHVPYVKRCCPGLPELDVTLGVVVSFLGPYDVHRFFGECATLRQTVDGYFSNIDLRTFSSHVDVFDETDYQTHLGASMTKHGFTFTTPVDPYRLQDPYRPLDIRKTAIALDQILTTLEGENGMEGEKRLLLLEVPGRQDARIREVSHLIGDTPNPTHIGYGYDTCTYMGIPLRGPYRIVMTGSVLTNTLGQGLKSHLQSLHARTTTCSFSNREWQLICRVPQMTEIALAAHACKLLERPLLTDVYTRCADQAPQGGGGGGIYMHYYMGKFKIDTTKANNDFLDCQAIGYDTFSAAGVAGAWVLGKAFEQQEEELDEKIDE